MNQFIQYMLACLFILVIGEGCIDEINLKGEQGDLTQLVVDGNFSNSQGPHRVRLTLPNKYNISTYNPVSGARVVLWDDQGNSAEYVEKAELENIYYELPAGISAQPGRSYHIEITTPGGLVYRSAPQALPAVVPLDTLRLNPRIVPRISADGIAIEDKKAFVEVQTTLPASAQPLYLRWDAHCVYYFPEIPIPSVLPPPTRQCYVYDYFNQQNLPLLVADPQSGGTIKYEIGSKQVDRAFEKSVYFNVVQYSMNAEAYQFWDKISKISNPEGTVFDAPPGGIKGNVYNVNNPEDLALGFFEVAAIDTFRIKAFNNTLGTAYSVTAYCEPSDYYFNRDQECFDCQRLANSTLKRPHYWQ